MNTHLVANRFPVVQDLLLEQLKKPRWEELEVLNVRLFGRPRSLKENGEKIRNIWDLFTRNGLLIFFMIHCEVFFNASLRLIKQRKEYLWCFRLTNAQGLSEVGIDCVVCFTLSFWWFNPVGDDLRDKTQYILVTRQIYVKCILGQDVFFIKTNILFFSSSLIWWCFGRIHHQAILSITVHFTFFK